MMSIDVNCLVMEPRRNLVAGVFGTCHSKFAMPYPLARMTWPFSATSTEPLRRPYSLYLVSRASSAAALSGVCAVRGRHRRRTTTRREEVRRMRPPEGLTLMGWTHVRQGYRDSSAC